MPNVKPPDAPPAVPAVVHLPAGSRLSRVHDSEFAADRFNPTLADTHWDGGRFDATDLDRYAYLYAGSDDECAICESLLRDLPLDLTGARFLPRAATAGRLLSRLILSADVPLVSLCNGKELARIGQGDNWLTSSPAAEYGQTRRWGHAIRRWAPDAAGLVWPSRRDPSKRAYVFFADRFTASLAEETGGSPPASGSLRLDSAEGERYLLEILARYHVTMPP